jgi:GNAT superfamily N-acetyltransferase
MRVHYAFDPDRFLPPGDQPEQGYAWFLGTQLSRVDVRIVVAERSGDVLGYVYAAIEQLSWKELRDEAGFIHDVVTEEDVRGAGVATALMEAAIEWIRSRGVPRVMLWTAAPNERARRLFEHLGFRPTMIEMTRELPERSAAPSH